MKTDQKEELLELLKKYPTIQACCAKLNIARATYYRWIKEDKNFARQANEALKDGIFSVNGIAEDYLVSRVIEGEKSAIYFWLKKRHREYMPIYRKLNGDVSAEKDNE